LYRSVKSACAREHEIKKYTGDDENLDGLHVSGAPTIDKLGSEKTRFENERFEAPRELCVEMSKTVYSLLNEFMD
jgi:hypothetical protein